MQTLRISFENTETKYPTINEPSISKFDLPSFSI